MIELLPISNLGLFERYCSEKVKDKEFHDSVSLSWETFVREDCDRLLLVGKVQSGKTSHFIGLTLKLFDGDFTTGIVFSGTKINLHNQTLERFQIEFNNLNVNILSDNDPNFVSKFREGDKNIVICLKHTRRIDNLSMLGLHFGKTFIIDDESDQASLNGHNKGNVLAQTLVASPTHHAIVVLINKLDAKYIQITATPAGHLLTSVLDYFKPNYILGLREHSNYFGNEELFKFQDKIIKWIIEDPKSPNRSNLVLFIGKHLENAYILQLKRPDLGNISAFIHPHHTIKTLSYYYTVIKDIINDLLTRTDKFVQENDMLLSQYFKLNVIDIIKGVVMNLELTLVAGNYDVGIVWEDYFKKNKFFILVGGGKLERGFTIEGLISTFMPRSQRMGNADTIQQRARFFGSKRDLLDYISVHLSEKTYDDFFEYYTNERYIYNLIKYPIRGDHFFYNYVTDNTNPCRENVLYNIRLFIGSNWRHYFCPMTSLEFMSILEHIGYKKSWVFISDYNCLIYTVERRAMVAALNMLHFLSFSDELSSKFGLISSLELSNLEELDIIILGNEIKCRERTAVLRNNHYVPEMVHQGHSSNYPGDRSLYIRDRLSIQLSFINLRNVNVEMLVSISIRLNDEN